MVQIDAKYQENGFQVFIYRQRRADDYTKCPECSRKVHHVATIFDEWNEAQSSLIHYHYCKRDSIIIQRVTRSDTPHQARTTTFEQPPHELLVELLATARQQNGRNVTHITINRRWWSPNKYPLHIGPELVIEDEYVEIGETFDASEGEIDLPIPRYEAPSSLSNNPFTSRRINGDSTPHAPTEEPEADDTDDKQ